MICLIDARITETTHLIEERYTSEQFCQDGTGRNSQGRLGRGKIGRTVCDKAHRCENNKQVEPINIEGNGSIDQS